MPGHIKVGGAWKELQGMHVKVGGAWKAVQAGYVKVSGVWKQFYANLAFNLADLNSSYSDVSSGADTYGVTLQLWGDGTIDITRNVNTDLTDQQVDYVLPNSALSNSYVRVLETSGSPFTSGDTANVWLQLNVDPRQFTFEYSTGGGFDLDSCGFTLQLSADGVSVDESKAMTFSAGSEP